MNSQIKRIVRQTELALLAVMSSLMGCWTEVRYEPAKTDPVTRQAERASPVTPQSEKAPTGSSSQSIPAANSDVIEAPPMAPNPSRTGQAAWQLGSQWSLGAALFAKDLPAERYRPMLEQAASAAQVLQLELATLPEVAADKDPVATIVTYLLDQQGPRLAEKLRKQYNPRHAALMELAIRSHMLLLVYSPRNLALDRETLDGGPLNKEQFQAWLDRLAELAGRSRLPEPVWSPLLAALRKQAPYTEVKRAVYELHRQVAAELASAG